MKTPILPPGARWLLAALLLPALLLHLGPWPMLAPLWLALGLVALVLQQGRQRARLLDWLRAPAAPPPPAGRGWQDINLQLTRMWREQQQARQASARASQQQGIAIEWMPDALVMLGEQDTILWRNRAAAALFSLPDTGRPVDHVINVPEFNRYLKAGRFQTPLQLQLPSQPGRIQQLQVLDTPDGGRLLVFHDVTDRFEVEQMQRDFVANVSHEIRTPLTVINGTLETLIDLDLPPEQRLHHLRTARRHGDTMLRLLADLLVLSSLDRSGSRPPDEDIDLALMLEDLTGEARALTGQAHDISLDCPGTLRLRGIGTEVETAIRNLLTNAIRYTPAGGRIDIGWQALADGGGELSVQDTGIGIEPRHLPRLTERFYRVDSSRSRQTGGTGLGLAIVQLIAQRHDAVLACRSTPGKGSRFALRWPAGRVQGMP